MYAYDERKLVEVLEFEDEGRGKGRLGFQTWVRIFGMLQKQKKGIVRPQEEIPRTV
jgi:hypothetical protein